VGKFKLRRYIIYREIDSRAGEPFDSALVERDSKKISGLGIFSRVETYVTGANDSVDIDFYLKEVWTLLPLVSIGRADGCFDWLVGIREKDLLGLYLDATIFYRRYEGENSYGAAASFPRAFGRDLAISWRLGENRQVDPLTFTDPITKRDSTVDYRYLNKYLSLGIGRRLHERVYVNVSVSYNRENWTIKEEKTLPPGGVHVLDYPRYQLGAGFNLGRVYYEKYFYEGTDLTAGTTLINEQPESRFRKWRVGLTGRAYIVRGDFNLAWRGQYLTSSADERIAPFYISGGVNVRGYLDKLVRGDHFLGSNIEVRWRSLETSRFYSQLAAFVDCGTIWGRGYDFSEAVNDPYISVGIGARLAIKSFLGNIGRADIALNTRTGGIEYYLATSQFF
ncbi:MAG: hypothetical protein KAT58_07620, partial [candidate division Zixibacteria bacterium]|nr:hypothetical protein [candidate division Zixibacteria bacterium]